MNVSVGQVTLEIDFNSQGKEMVSAASILLSPKCGFAPGDFVMALFNRRIARKVIMKTVKMKSFVAGICMMGWMTTGCTAQGIPCPSNLSSHSTALAKDLFSPPPIGNVRAEQNRFEPDMPFRIEPVRMEPVRTQSAAAIPPNSLATGPIRVARSLSTDSVSPPVLAGPAARTSSAAPAGYQLQVRASSRPVAMVPASTPAAPTIVTLRPNEDLVDVASHASGIILIDFFADWCGPCRTQGEILHSMKKTAARNGALIIKVNVDEHEEIASRLRVDALPTLMLVKDGKILDRRTGITQPKDLGELLAR